MWFRAGTVDSTSGWVYSTRQVYAVTYRDLNESSFNIVKKMSINAVFSFWEVIGAKAAGYDATFMSAEEWVTRTIDWNSQLFQRIAVAVLSDTRRSFSNRCQLNENFFIA